MKLTTTAESLFAALEASVRPDKQATIPILTYARLINNHLYVADLNNYSIVELQGDRDGDLDFLFPFRLVRDQLKEQTGPLTLELIDGGTNDRSDYVKLKHSGCAFAFNSLSVANFPAMPQLIEPVLTVDGTALKAMIGRTCFAI